MSISYIFLTALYNLRHNLVKTIVVVISMVLAISPLIILLSLGKAGPALVLKDFNSAGMDIIELTFDRDLSPILKHAMPFFKGIAENTVQDEIPVQMMNQFVKTTVVYIGGHYNEVKKLPVLYGRFITTKDVALKQTVCVVENHGLIPAPLRMADAIGEDIIINQRPFRIIGVVGTLTKPEEQSYTPPKIYIPKSMQFIGSPTISQLSFKAPSLDTVVSSTKLIETMIYRYYHFDSELQDKFQLQNRAEEVDTANKIVAKIRLFLLIGAVVAFGIGGMGISNIMMIAIKDRTNEIGTLKAIGAKKQEILTQFVLESTIIGAIGGLFGIIFGVLITFVLQIYFKIPVPVTWQSIVFSTVSSFGLGIVSGYIPASHAANMNPIEALSYEK